MVCTTLLLEGTGFELPVPRAMQGRPKAIIDGFGCMPPSLDYLRLPLVEISEGGPRRNLGTEALSREEPEVRIHLPPAASPLQTDFLSLICGNQAILATAPTTTLPSSGRTMPLCKFPEEARHSGSRRRVSGRRSRQVNIFAWRCGVARRPIPH